MSNTELKLGSFDSARCSLDYCCSVIIFGTRYSHSVPLAILFVDWPVLLKAVPNRLHVVLVNPEYGSLPTVSTYTKLCQYPPAFTATRRSNIELFFIPQHDTASQRLKTFDRVVAKLYHHQTGLLRVKPAPLPFSDTQLSGLSSKMRNRLTTVAGSSIRCIPRNPRKRGAETLFVKPPCIWPSDLAGRSPFVSWQSAPFEKINRTCRCCRNVYQLLRIRFRCFCDRSDDRAVRSPCS